MKEVDLQLKDNMSETDLTELIKIISKYKYSLRVGNVSRQLNESLNQPQINEIKEEPKSKKFKIDSKYEYISSTPGEFKLVYQPKAGKLFLTYRRGNNKVNSKYVTFITDGVANDFRELCKEVDAPNYKLSMEDPRHVNIIRHWSNLMLEKAKRNANED